MSYRYSSRMLVAVIAGPLMAALLTPTAQAEIVAYWQFNGDNFLDDSSGNGHTLSITAGTVTQVGDAALFSGGGGVLSANIDLTPYRLVRISWTQDTAITSNQEQIVFEQSPNYNSYPGALLITNQVASIYCGNGKYNYDNYAGATGPVSYSVLYNLDAAIGADVVKLFQGSTQIGTTSNNDQNLPGSSYKRFFGACGKSHDGSTSPGKFLYQLSCTSAH